MIIEYYENENPEKLKADKELKQYFDTFKSEPQIIEVWIDIENELLVKVLEEYTMKDILLHYILEQPYEEVPKETFVEKNYIYGSEVKEIKVPENVEIIDSTESVEK